MRSQYVEKFNHDEEASGYDQDIQNETDPIRTGYQALLNWVAETTNRHQPQRILELGSGTGNLSLQLQGYAELVCVDTSVKMFEIAQSKFSQEAAIHYVPTDLLEYFDQAEGMFDAIVSTYAIHHLTESEKELLFQKMSQSLVSGGIAVMGDLMFENSKEVARLLQSYRDQGQAELAEDIQDEFFWNLEQAIHCWEQLGTDVTTQRFSELSWGLFVKKRS